MNKYEIITRNNHDTVHDSANGGMRVFPAQGWTSLPATFPLTFPFGLRCDRSDFTVEFSTRK